MAKFFVNIFSTLGNFYKIMLVETNPGPTDHTQKKIEHKILAFRIITALLNWNKI